MSELDAIGIVCKDIGKSVEFYRLLGLEAKEVGGEEHWEATSSSGVRVMFDSVSLIRKLDPDWSPPTGKAIVLCFKQEGPKGVDEVYSRLIAAGHRGIKEPWDAFWGQRYASVEDPDGNQVDVFADLGS